jgi:hypothetical protein
LLLLQTPDLPQIQLPSMAIPSFDMPKINVPVPEFKSFPSIETAPTVMLESQEIRDKRAREALVAYKQNDEAAKLIEKQAADARMVAKESLKAAKLAKDEACVTRPGGKILCLRPWWNLGY